ncbi:MAG TPA: cytochrome c [Dongiaceae bacterium]|jgi:mono/diheme cytochrome c family protein|nr:cytochrome c [Dongiaceae bacterium]
MRYFLLIFALAVALVVLIAGPRGSMSRKPPISIFPDMDKQMKLLPQKDDSFFADGRSSRLPVPGTISRSAPYQDWPMYTGRVTGLTNFVENIPIPVTAELLARGKQRFEINCQPCHGPQADGNGITKKYGMLTVANLHDKRIVELPDGEIFNTITYGKGLMYPYGPNVEPHDRWAIIAYLRTLQRSQLGDINDVPEQDRAALSK